MRWSLGSTARSWLSGASHISGNFGGPLYAGFLWNGLPTKQGNIELSHRDGILNWNVAFDKALIIKEEVDGGASLCSKRSLLRSLGWGGKEIDYFRMSAFCAFLDMRKLMAKEGENVVAYVGVRVLMRLFIGLKRL